MKKRALHAVRMQNTGMHRRNLLTASCAAVCAASMMLHSVYAEEIFRVQSIAAVQTDASAYVKPDAAGLFEKYRVLYEIEYNDETGYSVHSSAVQTARGILEYAPDENGQTVLRYLAYSRRKYPKYEQEKGYSAEGFRYRILENGSAEIAGFDYSEMSGESVIRIPEALDGHPVVQIGQCAFGNAYVNMPNLREIVIPDTVELIFASAFQDAFDETVLNECSINLPKNLKYLGRLAFGNYTYRAIKTIAELPEAYQDYASHAIILPESLEYLDSNAFGTGYMVGKGGAILLSMPKSPVLISSKRASYLYLDNQYNLVSFEDALSYSINKDLYEHPGTLSYGGNSFEWKYQDGVLQISGAGELLGTGWSAMADPWLSIRNKIRKVIVDDGITLLGSDAYAANSISMFQNCTALTEVELPDSLTAIGTNCFSGCTALETIRLPDGVAEIGNSSFANCTALQTVRLPDALEKLGNSAFSGCRNLKAADLPQRLKIIGDSCFFGCGALEAVTIPDSAETISANCFTGCGQLKSITIPAKITALPERCFLKCNGLQEIMLPDTLCSIGAECFSGCKALEQIVLPDSVQTIGKKAFFETPYLTWQNRFCVDENGVLQFYLGRGKVIRIPETVKQISADVFSDNTELLSVTLPESVQTVPEYCFRNCSNLQELTVLSAQTMIEEQGSCGLTAIRGRKGSPAERYAAEHGLLFIDLDAKKPKQGLDMTLDLQTDCWHFGNTAAVFGEHYAMTDSDRERAEKFMIAESGQKPDGLWSGSCLGMSLTVILAKNGLLPPSVMQSGAQSVGEIEPDPKAISIINYYHMMQFSEQYIRAKTPFTPQSFLNMTKAAAHVKNGGSPFLIEVRISSGLHYIVGYGLEEGAWEWDGHTYDRRILIWDPNAPKGTDEKRHVYYDSVSLHSCIPAYHMHYAEGAADNTGEFQFWSDDMDSLNAHSYIEPVLCDFSNDGVRNIADAVLFARVLAEDHTVRVSDYAMKHADINADGELNVDDLLQLMKLF